MKCPECGRSDRLALEVRLSAKPLGSYSIAGAQPKVIATEQLAVVCTCGWFRYGHITEDGQHFQCD